MNYPEVLHLQLDHTFIEAIGFPVAFHDSTKYCHIVTHTISKQGFSQTLENIFFYWYQTAIENQSDTE